MIVELDLELLLSPALEDNGRRKVIWEDDQYNFWAPIHFELRGFQRTVWRQVYERITTRISVDTVSSRWGDHRVVWLEGTMKETAVPLGENLHLSKVSAIPAAVLDRAIIKANEMENNNGC